MSTKAKNNLAVTLGVVSLFLAGAGVLYFKSEADAMQVVTAKELEEAPLLVDVYRLVPQQFPLRFEARGVLTGHREVKVSAEVEGRVIARPIVEGQAVATGDVLCRIDETFHQLDVRAAEAELEKAKAEYANAENELRRIQNLGSDVKTELESGRYWTTHSLMQAAKEAAGIKLQLTKERLQRCVIVSPIDGMVARVFYERGELLSPMAPVVEIIDLSQMKLVVDLPEFEASKLDPQAQVTVTSAAWPGLSFHGAVRTTYPKADPLTRRIPVEILIDNSDRKLRSGSFVNCVIESTATTPSLVIPAKAVLHEFGSDYCFLARDEGGQSVIERQTIEYRPLAGSVTQVEVVSGLQAGDLVVVNRQRELTPGQVVSIRPRSPALASGRGKSENN